MAARARTLGRLEDIVNGGIIARWRKGCRYRAIYLAGTLPGARCRLVAVDGPELMFFTLSHRASGPEPQAPGGHVVDQGLGYHPYQTDQPQLRLTVNGAHALEEMGTRTQKACIGYVRALELTVPAPLLSMSPRAQPSDI